QYRGGAATGVRAVSIGDDDPALAPTAAPLVPAQCVSRLNDASGKAVEVGAVELIPLPAAVRADLPADVELVLEIGCTSDALASAKNVIRPSARRDVFLRDHGSVEVDVFGAGSAGVFTNALAAGAIGVRGRRGVNSLDVVLAVVSVLVNSVIKHVSGGIEGVADHLVFSAHEQLGLAAGACRKVLLQPICPGIIDKTISPAAFVGGGEAVQGIIAEGLSAAGVELVRDTEDIAVVLRTIII